MGPARQTHRNRKFIRLWRYKRAHGVGRSTDGSPYFDTHCLLISAHNDETLKRAAQEHVNFLGDYTGSFEALCHSSSVRCLHQHRRLAVIADSSAQAAQNMETFLKNDVHTSLASTQRAKKSRPKLAFVFSGQGSVWAGMGQSLVHDPRFRETVEACDALIPKTLDHPGLLETLNSTDPEALSRTDVAQVAIFAFQVGLTRILADYGIKPDGVIGHSIGEITAAHVAGILTLDDAIAVVHARGKLMRRHHLKGKMFEVALPDHVLREEVEQAGLTIAVINSPNSCIVSGETDRIEKFAKTLDARNLRCRWLRVDYAFHGHEMQELRPELERDISDINISELSTPLYSTVTGDKVENAALITAAHFGRNLADPVRFSEAIDKMCNDQFEAFVELSPHAILCHSMRECFQHSSHPGIAIPTLIKNRDHSKSLQLALGALFCEGIDVDWAKAFPQRLHHQPGPKVTWDRHPFWNADKARFSESKSGPHLLLGPRLRSPALQNIVFEIDLDKALVREHLIGDTAILPFAVFIELAKAAANTLGHGVLALNDAAVFAPLIIPTDSCPRAQLVIEVVDQILSKVTLCASFPSQVSESEHWTTHFSARFSARSTPSSTSLDVETIQDRCKSIVHGLDYYAELNRRGAQLGPRYQGIQKIWRADGEVLAELNSPSVLQQDGAGFLIHPSFLDTGLQLFLAAMPSEKHPKSGAYLPTQIGRVEIHAQCTKAMWGRCTLNKQTESMIDCDIQFFIPAKDDLPATLAISLESVRYLRAEQSSLASQVSRILRNDIYQTEWQPQPDDELHTDHASYSRQKHPSAK